GRLRSRRWRPAAWIVGAAFTLTTVDMMVNATRVWPRPFTMFDQGGSAPDLIAALALMMPPLVVSVAAVVGRFAPSSGEERLQLKWFAAAAVLAVATLIPSLTTNSVPVKRRADRGPAGVPAAPGRRPGPGAAAAGTQPARRRPARPGGPGHQAPPRPGGRRGGPGAGRGDLRRVAGRRRGRAGETAGPGPGPLPAAAGPPGAGRRA